MRCTAHGSEPPHKVIRQLDVTFQPYFYVLLASFQHSFNVLRGMKCKFVTHTAFL